MSLFHARPAGVSPGRSVAFRPSGAPARGVWHGARAAASPPRAATGDRAALGIAAILASTVAFPVSDLAAQSLLATLPSLEVAWLRYLVYFLATLPLLLRGRQVARSRQPGLQLLRGIGAAGGALAAIASFGVLAVPTTTAIGFVAPVMVTALAALVLKEAVGLRRWAAALVALAGVVVIVQPGGESFRPAALVPLVGAAAGAVAVICTRLNTADGPGTTVLWSAGTGLLALTVFALPVAQVPTLPQAGLILVVGLFGALGSFLQVLAYRWAPASLLSPFTYAQLIWASGLSFLLLGTAPGGAMFVGAGMIALSAFYTAWRERVRGVA